MPRRRKDNFKTTATGILIQPELSSTKHDGSHNAREYVLSRNIKRANVRANVFPFFKGGVFLSTALWAGVKGGLSRLIFLPAAAALTGYGFKSARDYGQQSAKAFETLRFSHNNAKEYSRLADNLSSDNSQDYVFQGVFAQALFSLNAYNDDHAKALVKLFEKIELTSDLFDVWYESGKYNQIDDFANKLESQVEKVFAMVEAKVDSCVSDKNSTLAHMYNSRNMLREQIGKVPVQHGYQATSWITQLSEFLGCARTHTHSDPHNAPHTDPDESPQLQ